jgi:hypothetical protein
MSHRRARLILVAAATLVALGGAEAALRWSGRAPAPRRPDWNRSPLVADDRLGHVITPGVSDIEFRAGPLVRTARVTRGDDGRRITRPLSEDADAPPPRPQIWVFGCSFTFGTMLSDDQTFPWIAQMRLREYDVVNFGVPGYSTLQMLIRLEEALERPDRPAVVVLTYATFHEQRNVCSRAWRTGSGLPFRYPCARMGPDGTLTRIMLERTQPRLPLADSLAIVNTLESAINRFEEIGLHAGDVTERLIREVVSLCRRERVPVVIADVFEDGRGLPMLRRFADDGVPVLSIAPDYRARGMTFAPHDPHPAPDGARWLGEHLASGLRESVLR